MEEVERRLCQHQATLRLHVRSPETLTSEPASQGAPIHISALIPNLEIRNATDTPRRDEYRTPSHSLQTDVTRLRRYYVVEHRVLSTDRPELRRSTVREGSLSTAYRKLLYDVHQCTTSRFDLQTYALYSYVLY